MGVSYYNPNTNPNSVSTGSIVDGAVSTSKLADSAVTGAKMAAGAIVALLTGRQVNPEPVIANVCYGYVSDKEAIHVTSVHRYDSGIKTILPVAGAGGVSPQRSELEKAYADTWSRNIWADTLG